MIQNDILWVNENSYLNILNNWKATQSESKLGNKPKKTNKQTKKKVLKKQIQHTFLLK